MIEYKAMAYELAKICIDAGGVAIALIGGARALVEYQKKVAQDRFQMLMKMQDNFHSNESFRRIREEFDGQNSFENMSKGERAEYATFFEDVALLRRSRLLRAELAFYMFGFEALRCWENKKFWEGLDRDDKWWGVFRAFASELQILRERVKPNQVRL
jgi:hypothetical protein